MSKKLLELAAEITQAQASLNKMSAAEIELALMRTYNTLYNMQQAEEQGKSLSSQVKEDQASSEALPDLKASLLDNKVICLECGAEMRQLTANHLRTHNMTPREYKKKWGFPLKQPLSAKSLTRSRSRSAKKRGLPPELLKFQEERRQQKKKESLS